MAPPVISLCDRTGVMVEPWRQAGYDCHIVDIQHTPGVTFDQERPGLVQWGMTVNEFVGTFHIAPRIVFAFPPCTNLANSGARWFQDKGLRGLIDGLEVVEQCREFCEASGAPWMIENPVGQLATYWRKPDMTFNPCDYAGWADDPDAEAYTKRTCLWVGGGWQPPTRRPVEPTLGSLFHRTPPGPERANIRSVTPAGFARAVFEANAHACVNSGADN